MTKHQYSLKNFLRLAPNDLLARYFHERDLLTELDFSSLDDNDIEPIYEAWCQLSDSERPETEEDFQLIESVANDNGIMTILEEATFHNIDLEPVFAQMKGFEQKALWSFLEHGECVEIAAQFCQTDELPKIYWRDRDGLPEISPRDDKAACEDLANILKLYFRQKEGRGYSCSVDVLRRGSRYYYFAYPEDHSRTLMEYEGQGDKLRRRAHRPVFEVVFVYDPKKGMLSTYFDGKAAVVSDLQQLFAREILVMNLPDPDRDQRVYDLNALKRRGFSFRYSPSSGIVDIRVKLLKFSTIGGGSRRIVIDVNPNQNPESLYDLLDDVLNTGEPGSSGNHIPLSMVNVDKIGLKAYFIPSGRRRKPTKTFYVSCPNSCSLEHEGQDQVLRQMLIDSDIEPKVISASQTLI